ncbi:MAG: protein-L-isoaspartate(D-aspartate) O-methyltransferase [Magnetospirillum sp. WYHS-4]
MTVDEARLKELRRRLMDEIRADAAETRRFTGRAAFSPAVMEAMAKVPRHLFVAEDDIPYAYGNRPREIGHGQTISQPYIVALMTDLLDPDPCDRVLEIGTGSGYQSAVLAEVVAEVWSIETIEPLARQAAERLKRLGYANVRVRHGDGYEGWPEEAPFDGILVAAAPPEVPEALLAQLKPGGRLVIPVGLPYDTQILMVCTRNAAGKPACEEILPVAFVPMVKGRHQFRP